MPQRFLRRCAVLAVALFALSVGTGGAVAHARTTQPTTKQIQRALGIKADGAYGPQTRRAMKRFQRAHRLKVTGRPNAQTIAALGLTPVSTDRGFNAAGSSDAAAFLAKIAQCESGGDPAAVSANRQYFGKYQFSQATWESLGGKGNPAEAEEATQDAMAMKLYQQRGRAPWPSCSAAVA